MFTKYAKPEEVGWLGWFEDADGNATAFVDLHGHCVFMSDLN